MLWQRRSAELVCLFSKAAVSGTRAYRGTRPLPGDWDLVRFTYRVGVVKAGKIMWAGFRLATDVAASSAEWGLGERLFHGTEEGAYQGDGVVATHSQGQEYEGPWRIRPRGRRLCVEFGNTWSNAAYQQVTFVLQQV